VYCAHFIWVNAILTIGNSSCGDEIEMIQFFTVFTMNMSIGCGFHKEMGGPDSQVDNGMNTINVTYPRCYRIIWQGRKFYSPSTV